MNIPRCAKCEAEFCYEGITDEGVLPDYCPMKNKRQLLLKAQERYNDEDIKGIYPPATVNEREAYKWIEGRLTPVRPRIKELIEFGKKLGIDKIGIALCVGLRDEARRVHKFLEEDFEVYSVRCKCGGIDKSDLGVAKEHKIRDPEKFEAGCNPVAQAYLLNDAGTELNVIVGLCIGHDIIFTMESKVPVTTLIVKDRFTGHNPVISLYTMYHRRAF